MIETGDKVTVIFTKPMYLPGVPGMSKFIEGILRNIPGDTGDWWHIETDTAYIMLNPMCLDLVGIVKRK